MIGTSEGRIDRPNVLRLYCSPNAVPERGHVLAGPVKHRCRSATFVNIGVCQTASVNLLSKSTLNYSDTSQFVSCGNYNSFRFGNDQREPEMRSTDGIFSLLLRQVSIVEQIQEQEQKSELQQVRRHLDIRDLVAGIHVTLLLARGRLDMIRSCHATISDLPDDSLCTSLTWLLLSCYTFGSRAMLCSQSNALSNEHLIQIIQFISF